MADDVVRITGEILRVDNRSGVSPKNNQPYSFNTASVLVGGLGLCSLDVPDDHLDTLVAGTSIDIAATLSVFNNRPTLRPLSVFPTSKAS